MLPIPLTLSASLARTLLRWLCCLLVSVQSNPTLGATEGLKIPNLGQASTSLFSTDYEHQLGRTWLKVFRSQAPVMDDPVLYAYLESLVFDLVSHSELQDRRIELVVVDNPSINAFAVPGGMIGINNGLFL